MKKKRVANEKKRMKLAVFVDTLEQLGGVERMIFMLNRHFDIDVYTGVYLPDKTFPELRKIRVHQITRGKAIIPEFQHLANRRAFRRLRLKKRYDHFISFGGASLLIAKHHRPNTFYCNAPIRWLYDLREHEARRLPFLKRLAFYGFSYFIRRDDQAALHSIERIVTNSENVSRRIRKYYGREPDRVIHPPTNLHDFRFKEHGDFFLSTERVDPINRVDIVVRAFQQMPEKRLVITSGGTDLPKIRKMAEGYPNIEVKGWVSEKELYELYATCLAGITMEREADYSMIPNEFNAAGKPCFCSREGGLPETIIEGKTGYFVDPPVTSEKVKKLIESIPRKKLTAMKSACIKNAEKVSEEHFIKNLKEVMNT